MHARKSTGLGADRRRPPRLVLGVGAVCATGSREREGALEQRPAVVGEGQTECLTESARADRELLLGRRR